MIIRVGARSDSLQMQAGDEHNATGTWATRLREVTTYGFCASMIRNSFVECAAMSKELDEMIASAMREEAMEKEKEIYKPPEYSTIPEHEQEENLQKLIGAFEHYMGKEASEELEPEYAIAGRSGTIHLKADGKDFELEVEDLEDKEFLKKRHPLYAAELDGEEIACLEKVAFDETLKTKVLAAIGRYLGKGSSPAAA